MVNYDVNEVKDYVSNLENELRESRANGVRQMLNYHNWVL